MGIEVVGPDRSSINATTIGPGGHKVSTSHVADEIRDLANAKASGRKENAAQRGEVDGTEKKVIRAAILRAQAGDMDALRLLYTHFARDVFRWVRTVVHDSHEAEDITQTVFLKLITVLHRYEERDDVPFAAWIRKVARNCALDHIRAGQQLPSEQIELGCEGGQVDVDRRRDLWSAINSLPREQREVIVLRHIHGLSPVEIAALLGKSESSIHGLHHRGRHNLRGSLQELGAAPVVATRASGSPPA